MADRIADGYVKVDSEALLALCNQADADVTRRMQDELDRYKAEEAQYEAMTWFGRWIRGYPSRSWWLGSTSYDSSFVDRVRLAAEGGEVYLSLGDHARLVRLARAAACYGLLGE